MRPLRATLRGWRYLYGENPLHLLAMIGCFALVGYAVTFVYPGPSAIALALWFGGAVIAHDLVLYPLYALADQSLTVSRWARRKVLPDHPPRVPAINHVRVPVLGSAVLGLIYFPTITGRSEEALRFAAGLSTEGIFRNWLLVTGVLFLGSAVIYALRLGVAAGRSLTSRLRRSRATDADPGTPGTHGEDATVTSALSPLPSTDRDQRATRGPSDTP